MNVIDMIKSGLIEKLKKEPHFERARQSHARSICELILDFRIGSKIYCPAL